jgi:hypothetical protein
MDNDLGQLGLIIVFLFPKSHVSFVTNFIALFAAHKKTAFRSWQPLSQPATIFWPKTSITSIPDRPG